MKAKLHLAALMAAFSLAGCATNQAPQGVETMLGVQIDPRDYAECASQQDCTVWSGRQLQGMAEYFFKQGREEGARNRL